MAATVIGAQGFVGRRLAQRLAETGEAAWLPAKGDPQLFERDLGVVYYCAGLTADYDRRPFDTVEAHVGLLSRLAEHGRFERLIYLSSTRLYDGQPKFIVDEADPLLMAPSNPRHIYDLSKALGENVTLTRTAGRGAVARLANVYDWRDGSPGFLSEWLIAARQTRDLRLESNPNIARDYIHLDDVVDALIAMAKADDAGTVNVASGRLATNADIAEVFGRFGWNVTFSNQDDPPAPPPGVLIDKLRGLGVAPRSVSAVVSGYLEGLAA